jgi:hypothetical protein
MANIRKSFNFRNGVQVDNNNFVVNANGLVGIGSSAPTVKLDVAGGVKVSGLVTSSTLGCGIGTITNFTATNASVGVLTATTLSVGGNTITNIVGFGFTAFVTDNGGVGLHTTSKIGIGVTTSPGASDSELTVSGNVNTTGIITANSFSGDLNGNVNAASGVSTFTQLKVGTAITMSAGTISATTFSGSLPTSSLTGTISSSQIANLAVLDANINGMSASKLTGALPAISGAAVTSVTAIGLTGSPNVNLGVTTTGNLTAGTITGAGLSVTSIGIGTNDPANAFQLRATNNTELQITSETGVAGLTVGRETGTNNTNNAEIRYGGGSGFPFSGAQSFDLINYGTGNFNYHLSANNAGSAAGDFIWHKGASTSQLMTLTNGGNLGIGITNPTQKLSVQGISTFTGNAHFDGNITVGGNINGNFILQDVITSNINPASGVSTVTSLNIVGSGANRLGIGTDSPTTDLDATGKTAKFERIGINTVNAIYNVDVVGGVRATQGFLSDGSSPVEIKVDGSNLVFNVVGVGSTSFALI